MSNTDSTFSTPTMRLHHVGYAVADIQAYLDDFMRPLFAPVQVTDAVADPLQRVRVCFVEMQGGTLIELVEPLGENSPISGIIGSRRGGLYHLCYEVDDLDTEIARFRARRCFPLARPTPAVAFDGRRIVFLMTPQHDLIELLERDPEGSTARGGD
jgi:methylmalonyl-CoA/ethylmalonyl-CoA epimerase